MSYSRYAVYYTPRPGPLHDFGAAWLGWDAASGQPVAHPPVEGVETWTATPRKYGFHGTLKPPFRLAEGATEETLAEALTRFAAAQPAVVLSGLRLAQLGHFLALIPAGSQDDLAQLAERVVMDLDGFRAPLNEAELARRRAAGLTPRQDALLTRWGYPYVMEEFRFHLTLTGRLSGGEIDGVQATLAPLVRPLLEGPFEVADLTLLGEGPDGRFHHVARAALSG